MHEFRVSVFDNAHLCMADDVAKDGGFKHAAVADALVFFSARYLFLSHCPLDK